MQSKRKSENFILSSTFPVFSPWLVYCALFSARGEAEAIVNVAKAEAQSILEVSLRLFVFLYLGLLAFCSSVVCVSRPENEHADTPTTVTSLFFVILSSSWFLILFLLFLFHLSLSVFVVIWWGSCVKCYVVLFSFLVLFFCSFRFHPPCARQEKMLWLISSHSSIWRLWDQFFVQPTQIFISCLLLQLRSKRLKHWESILSCLHIPLLHHLLLRPLPLHPRLSLRLFLLERAPEVQLSPWLLPLPLPLPLHRQYMHR